MILHANEKFQRYIIDHMLSTVSLSVWDEYLRYLLVFVNFNEGLDNHEDEWLNMAYYFCLWLNTILFIANEL